MTDETSWSLVEDAARGEREARDSIARIYLPVVDVYFRARWARRGMIDLVDDAVQDVFMDLMRPAGALARAERHHAGGGFRAFLRGVARNVALRYEERAVRRGRREVALDTHGTDEIEALDDAPPRAFDKAWAQALMKAARERQARRAARAGEEALRRVELLRLRFVEGLPIRAIAARWGERPQRIHQEYARARREFADALTATVAVHQPGTPGEVHRECVRLLGLLR